MSDWAKRDRDPPEHAAEASPSETPSETRGRDRAIAGAIGCGVLVVLGLGVVGGISLMQRFETSARDNSFHQGEWNSSITSCHICNKSL